jgi:Protein of unknown function (DUF2946)
LPATLANFLRRCRRPIVAIAVVLTVLQSVLVGLATAQVAAAAVPGPFDSAICHGAGGSGTPDGTGSADQRGSDQHANTCCTFCLAAAPGLPALDAPDVPGLRRVRVSVPAVCHGGAATIPWRAVRAGRSQGPPSATLA